MAFMEKSKEYRPVFRKKNLETKATILKGGTDKGYIIIPGAVMMDLSLSPYEKLVYGYLLNCIRKQGRGKCNPADLNIAANCGISVKQVYRARIKLKDQMWIRWERTGTSNEYTLNAGGEHDVLISQMADAREARSKSAHKNDQ
jgi:hypothetical protein